MARRVHIPWGTIATFGLVFGTIGIISHRSKSTSAPSKRVALIGDSYAVGLGPELDKLLPDFRYEGHVGTNTAQWAAGTSACGQCGSWIVPFHPELVLVSLGVNDGATPNPANYQRIVQALHGIGARVTWIAPPAGVNVPAERSIIASLGVPVILPTKTPLSADGLHPKSYATWAREIAQSIGVV